MVTALGRTFQYRLNISSISIIIIFLSTLQLTDLGDFDVREATIARIHAALYSHRTTCRAIVQAYLARIETYNPAINAIIALNTKALSVADGLDALLAAGHSMGPLFCIPILLKDNFDTHDLPTTAGCRALRDAQPAADAAVVNALRDAGAVVMGKTNMHEMALEGLTVSSLGGQTVNPYDLTRTPGGSSGGTGAAIAASFALLGTGTDTMNSLRNPASANSLYSIRPTRGLISRTGIIPVSSTQDVVGPIARTIEDLAVALAVMASTDYDATDRPTALTSDFASKFDHGTLRGKRLGLIEGFHNRTLCKETSPVNDVMEVTVSKLLAAGAEVVSVTSPHYNSSDILASCDTQRFEHREQLDEYLSRTSHQGTYPTSFQDLYNSNDFLVIPRQYPLIKDASASSTANASYRQTLSNIDDITSIVKSTFAENDLDALIYPEQSNLVVKIGSQSQVGRNGILAAVTGFPVVTVPVGFSPPTVDAPKGVPIGMEVLGLQWSETELLSTAKSIAEVVTVRKIPQSTEKEVARRKYKAVPKIVPDTRNIPDVYPIGVLE
ncbi:MAG: hypothetical protein Q9163_005931 [Psora crenata]